MGAFSGGNLISIEKNGETGTQVVVGYADQIIWPYERLRILLDTFGRWHNNFIRSFRSIFCTLLAVLVFGPNGHLSLLIFQHYISSGLYGTLASV